MRSNDEIVKIIDSRREELGLSVSELARRVGMAKSALSRYFNKTREFPLNKVEDFGNVLNLSSEYILGFDETEKSTSIESVYSQLEDTRKEKVLNFALNQLEEQNAVQNEIDKNEEFMNDLSAFIDEFGQDAYEDLYKFIINKRKKNDDNADAV